MKIIRTKIEINASADQVWQVLTDIDKYPEWNPFIKKISGNLHPGERLKVIIHPPGKKESVFKPVVLKVDKNREFCWLGHLFFPGIFDGEHRFQIESISDSSVLFHHNEHFSGILVPVFWKTLFNHVRIGFMEMNQALKLHVEHKKGPQ